jgi:hypothetical protein
MEAEKEQEQEPKQGNETIQSCVPCHSLNIQDIIPPQELLQVSIDPPSQDEDLFISFLIHFESISNSFLLSQ